MKRAAKDRTGEYMALDWGDSLPAFYAVRGHVEPTSAAAAVNAAEDSEFAAADFKHGWLKFRFTCFIDGPAWLLAEESEKPNIRVTVTVV